jgi:hypothetical protein
MQPKPRIIEVLQKGLKCSDKLAQGSIIVSITCISFESCPV